MIVGIGCDIIEIERIAGNKERIFYPASVYC